MQRGVIVGRSVTTKPVYEILMDAVSFADPPNAERMRELDQSSLEVVRLPITQTSLGKYFEYFDGEKYVCNAFMRESYPDG
jgi:hypothetical protein